MSPESDSQALANEAQRLLRVGRLDEAERACRALLLASPDDLTALMILGTLCLAAGRWAEAEQVLLRGCSAHPYVVGFHAALGRMWVGRGQPSRALAPLETCVILEPEIRDHRVRLLSAYQSVSFVEFDAVSRAAMLACLADDRLTHSLMHKAWLSLLRIDPDSSAILRLFDGAGDYPSFRTAVSAEPSLLAGLERGTLLRRGLERLLAADVAIERGLTFVRRWFFEHRGDPLHGPAAALPVVCALARYCALSDYVFEVAEDYAPLREDVSAPADCALLGCYEPLWLHPRARELARLSDDPGYRDFARSLIEQPLEERRLQGSIPSVGPIEAEVSRAVRQQYEENPYPRWISVGSGAPSVTGTRGRGRRILIAGCGTGSDAADVALTFPGAAVDAIDLSRASLAYGARQARAMGIENLWFGQADLLHVDRLGKIYDLIQAAGVLHHMADPVEGLRALVAVLRPGGILRMALYSQLARAPVAEARAFIARSGFAPTPQGIRAFRAAVLARPAGDSLRAWLTRSYDFYSLSHCRDLVFHVQEHTFTLPQIAGIARACGLSVVHFDVPSPGALAAFRHRFPGIADATDLERWHIVEEANPSMFSGMYGLWLCRTADIGSVDTSWLEADDRGV